MRLPNSHVKAFNDVFSYCLPSEKALDAKNVKQTVILNCIKFITYIPLISTIFAGFVLYVNRNSKAKNPEDKAIIARCIISATSLGVIVLLPLDIIATFILKPAFFGYQSHLDSKNRKITMLIGRINSNKQRV